MKRTIVVAGGYWSTNIGNSFFQLGAKYILEKVFQNDKVIMLADQPGYWNTKLGNPANAFNILDHINPDYFVILGPFLRKENKKIWQTTMKILKEKGIKVIVLGAGMMKYDSEEIDLGREMLAETFPLIFASRDTETFNNFSDLAQNSYDGIDPAFFVSDVFEPIRIDIGKYIIFNFDQMPEPLVTISSDRPKGNNAFEYEGQWWSLNPPRIKYILSTRFKVYPYLDALFSTREFPEKLGDRLIIRTDHRFNPMMIRKVYRAKNSFVSDLPYTYLNLYANTEITFTNRVHACVATLAYGRPAMLFSKSPRVRLLERIGAVNIGQRPETIPLEKLASEKEKLLGFLRKAIE